MSAPVPRGSDRRLLLGFGLAALAIQLPLFDRWFLLLDEGYILAIADAINHGQVVYRDVVIDAPFPGAFYLLAAWFRLAGTSIYSARVLAVLVFVAFAVLVLRVASEVLSRRMTVALGVALLCYRMWAFPHWHVFSYSSAASTFLTASVAFTAIHLRRGTRAPLVLGGLCAGAGIVCKQDYGLAVTGMQGLLLLACSVVTGLRPPGARTTVPALWFTLGGLAVIAPVFAALGWAGALPGMWEQTFKVPLEGALGGHYVTIPPLRPLLHQDQVLRGFIGHYFPAIEVSVRWLEVSRGYWFSETPLWDVLLKVIYHAPFVVLPLAWLALGLPALARLRRRTSTVDDALTLLVLAYATGFLAAFNRPRDWVHLMMIYPPTLTLSAMLLARLRGWLPTWPRRLATAAVALAGLVIVERSVEVGVLLREVHQWPIAAPRAGIYTNDSHGPLIDDLIAYVESRVPPGATLPVYPVQPAINFLAARPTAAGFYVIWPVQAAGRDERIIAAIEADHVDTVIYSLSQFTHLGMFEDNAPKLFAYLATHFEIDRVFSREIWGPMICGLRRRGPAVGESLLDRVPAEGPVRRGVWPFAPVLLAPTGTPESPSRAAIALPPLPAGAHLRFGYGVNPNRWEDFAVGAVTFVLRAGDAVLFEATIDPSHRLEERHWFDGDVDLSRFAGQTPSMSFETRTAAAAQDPDAVAAWADPRVVGVGDLPQSGD